MFDTDVGDEGDSRPKILWSVFFTQNDTSGMTVNGNLPDNMFVVDGPNLDLDFDYCIKKVSYYHVNFYRPRTQYDGRLCFYRCLSVNTGGGGGFTPSWPRWVPSWPR